MSENDCIIHSTLEEGYDFFITDKWKKKFHFKISTFSVPSGMLSEAIEVVNDKTGLEPYIFTILSDFDSDIEYSEIMLKAKIKKGINQRHLQFENGKLEINNRLELRGRIEWNENLSDSEFEHMFVIDGKRITMEKFGEILQSFPGWNFKFKIFDMTDEMD